jgi:hypothetical protein
MVRLGDCGRRVVLGAGAQTGKPGSRMNRKCKQCGGIIGSVPETTCKCPLLRVDMRDGKQFVATQNELSTIIEILRNEVRSDMQDGMNKKQEQRDRAGER